MGDIYSEEYAGWCEGLESGHNSSINIIKEELKKQTSKDIIKVLNRLLRKIKKERDSP